MDKPHAHKLRVGRHSEPGRLYVLTTVTAGRGNLFADFEAGRLLVCELRRAENEGLVRSLAWVIMPDHLHWLVDLHDAPLDRLMRQVKSRSAIALNRYRDRQDRVWQPGYHDRALRHEEDVAAVARYIVANPLRAGLVQRLGDYPLWDAIWL